MLLTIKRQSEAERSDGAVLNDPCEVLKEVYDDLKLKPID